MKLEFCALYVSYEVFTRSGKRRLVHYQLQLNDKTAEELHRHVAQAINGVRVSARQPEWNFM